MSIRRRHFATLSPSSSYEETGSRSIGADHAFMVGDDIRRAEEHGTTARTGDIPLMPHGSVITGIRRHFEKLVNESIWQISSRWRAISSQIFQVNIVDAADTRLSGNDNTYDEP